MKKIVVSLLALGILLFFLWYIDVLEFSWLKVDMGWCQKFGRGIRIFQIVIFELPQRGASACV